MNQIIKFIDCFFSKEWIMQEVLMKTHQKNSRIISIIDNFCVTAFFILAFIFFVILKEYNTISLVILGILATITFITNFISKSLKALTTVTGFLTTGIMTVIVTFLVVLMIVEKYIDITPLNEKVMLYEYIKFNYVGYFIACLTFAVIWNLFSSFCNAKVATLCNAIITAMVGIILEFKSLIFLFLPAQLGVFEEAELAELEALGYSEMQIFELVFSIIIFPILVTLGLATIVCAIKTYWIETHNNNNDIIYKKPNSDSKKKLDDKIIVLEQSNN